MDIINTVLGFFSDIDFGAWISAITGIVTACTAIAVLTPTPKDDAALAWIYKIISVLSGNVGHNK